MTAIPVGFAEATFIFLRSGAVRQSTWALGFDDANFGTRTPATMAGSFRSAFSDTNLKPYHTENMCGHWSFLGVSVTKMLESGPVVGTSMVTVVGSSAGSEMTPNVAVLINKQTDLGGRRNRGRAFIPPVYPPETNVDAGGIIDGGVVTTMQNTYNAAFGVLIAGEVTPVVFHQSAPFTPTPLQDDGLIVQAMVATQRRRLRR